MILLMNLFKKYRWILLLIILSAILRGFIYFQVMNITPFADYFDYKQWIYRNYSLGFHNLYVINPTTRAANINQPPGTIYILRGSFEVFLQTARVLTHFMHLTPGATLWVNDSLLIFFVRLPSILADLILGFAIYVMVKTKTSEKLALAAAAIYLLSPPLIYNSTVWGQMDSINNLFFYLSLMFLIKKRALPSVLFFALSLFTKLSLLPLIPLYLLLALFGGFFKRKAFAISVAVTGLIILLLNLPFSTNPFWLLEFVIKASPGESQVITVNAFNFWWLIFNPILRVSPPDIFTVVLGLTLNMWGNLIFAGFYLSVVLCFWKLIKKRKLTTDKVFLFFAIVAFITFLFLPKMHERYLYPVFPLLVTWVGFKNKYWIATILLSLIHFINLYVVWNPIFLFRSFETVIRSQAGDRFLSLATLLIFGFFYIKMFSIPKFSFKLKFTSSIKHLPMKIRRK